MLGSERRIPTFSDKRQAADIAAEIQRQIGGYLFTITLMNTAVGVVTGTAMWAIGLGDPILWGSVAFALNYVPILGPLTGIGLFLVVWNRDPGNAHVLPFACPCLCVYPHFRR